MWDDIKLKDICKIKPVKKLVKDILSEEDQVSFVPMDNLGIDKKYFRSTQKRDLGSVYKGYTYFGDNDVLLAKITPCFENGKLGIAKNLFNGIGFGSSEFLVFRAKENLLPEYLYYFLSRASFRENGAKFMTGAVGHKRIPMDFIENVDIPLPSLEEQKRIVAILDEAFAGIDKAIENTEKNLANAKELFESYLNNIFTQKGEGWVDEKLENICHRVSVGHVGPTSKFYCDEDSGVPFLRSQNIRPRNLSLKGLRFVTNEFHQSLKKSQLKTGDILFVRVGANRGDCCILPSGVGEINCANIVFARPKNKNYSYLEFYMQSSLARKRLLGMTTGSAQGVINTSSVAELLVPIIPENSRENLIRNISNASKRINRLQNSYQQKLTALKELKQSLLQKAFAGELTESDTVDTTAPEYTANIIAIAFARHAKFEKEKTFGHVKTQKLLHLIEAVGGVDLGREPIKDAAGPNDFKHMAKAEEWAKENKFFEFVKRGKGYDFIKHSRFDKHLPHAEAALAEYKDACTKIIDLLVPLNTRQAELVATVHAAWNNLLLDGKKPSEDDIVHEARENWHSDKLKIPRHEFIEALARIRRENIMPKGMGKRVTGQEVLL